MSPPRAPEEAPAAERPAAPFGRRLLEVLANDPLGAYRLLRVADPDGPAPRAGQFAMLAAETGWGTGERGRPFLPRAFSYARFAEGQAEFLLEDVGPGTSRLCALAPGEPLWLLGPLGQGFRDPQDGRRALLVGGGVGIAPLAIWQDQLQAVGAPARALLGFRDRPRLPGATLLREPRIATEDGAAGHHGLVTDLLLEELRAEDGTDQDAGSGCQVYACGPPAMLEAVRALCARHALPAQLALEAPMACGFGACWGCAHPARGGAYIRVCCDGPVVDAEDLDRVAP